MQDERYDDAKIIHAAAARAETGGPFSAKSENDFVDSLIELGISEMSRLDSREASDSAIRALSEFGLPTNQQWTEDELDDIALWTPESDIKRNSVFMDGTALHVAQLVVQKPQLINPMLLWDLAEVIDRIVASDHVYHVGNEHLDALNAHLEDEVFSSLYNPALNKGGLGRAFSIVVDRSIMSLVAMAEVFDNILAGDRGILIDEHKSVVYAWRAVLGRFVRWTEAFYGDGRSMLVPAEWATSPSGTTEVTRYIKRSTPIERVAYSDFYLPKLAPDQFNSKWTGPRGSNQDNDWEEDPEHSNESHWVLTDIVLRSYVNQGTANLAGLPYAPATARMPFQRSLYERNSRIEDRLRSVTLANQAYNSLSDRPRMAAPVFFAVVLSRITRLEELWPAVAQLRHEARHYRKRRHELDQAIANSESSDTVRKIVSATQSEALHLSDGGRLAGEMIAFALGRLGVGTLSDARQLIPDATRLLQSNLSADVRQRISWRLFKPHLYFFSRLRTMSREMDNIMPQVGRLWSIPEREWSGFRKRFNDFGQLRDVDFS